MYVVLVTTISFAPVWENFSWKASPLKLCFLYDFFILEQDEHIAEFKTRIQAMKIKHFPSVKKKTIKTESIEF